MTKDFSFVVRDTLMPEVDKIFTSRDFHILPVLNENHQAVGVISKTDYSILLHHFTHKKVGEYEKYNRMYLRSLRAEDVMSKTVVSIQEDQSIEMGLDLFLKHKKRSLIVQNKEGVCVGICTPFDIILWIKELKNANASQLV